MWKRAWSVVAFAVSLAGCVTQLTLMSSHYFAYDTVTQVTISRSAMLRPPKLVICMPRWYYIFMDEMTEMEVLERLSPIEELVAWVTVQNPDNATLQWFQTQDHVETD